jgi:hypothetical protein
MSGKDDWVRLLVKYKAKCSQCAREIPQGEYALWSKTSRVVKHLNCPADKDAGEKKGTDTAVLDLQCFLCGKSARCAECGFETNCNREIVSQACICDQCLSDANSYENYQRAFLTAMRKVAKVKI